MNPCLVGGPSNLTGGESSQGSSAPGDCGPNQNGLRVGTEQLPQQESRTGEVLTPQVNGFDIQNPVPPQMRLVYEDDDLDSLARLFLEDFPVTVFSYVDDDAFVQDFDNVHVCDKVDLSIKCNGHGVKFYYNVDSKCSQCDSLEHLLKGHFIMVSKKLLKIVAVRNTIYKMGHSPRRTHNIYACARVIEDRSRAIINAARIRFADMTPREAQICQDPRWWNWFSFEIPRGPTWNQESIGMQGGSSSKGDGPNRNTKQRNSNNNNNGKNQQRRVGKNKAKQTANQALMNQVGEAQGQADAAIALVNDIINNGVPVLPADRPLEVAIPIDPRAAEEAERKLGLEILSSGPPPSSAPDLAIKFQEEEYQATSARDIALGNMILTSGPPPTAPSLDEFVSRQEYEATRERDLREGLLLSTAAPPPKAPPIQPFVAIQIEDENREPCWDVTSSTVDFVTHMRQGWEFEIYEVAKSFWWFVYLIITAGLALISFLLTLRVAITEARWVVFGISPTLFFAVGFCFLVKLPSSFETHPLLYWFFNRRRTEFYQLIRMVNAPQEDLRPDSLALGELKHMDCYYAEVRSVRYERYFYFFVHRNEVTLKVSFEALAQLMPITQTGLVHDEKVAWEKISYAARSLHSVALNRYNDILKRHILQDTTILGFALYRKYLLRRCSQNFPRPLKV